MDKKGWIWERTFCTELGAWWCFVLCVWDYGMESHGQKWVINVFILKSPSCIEIIALACVDTDSVPVRVYNILSKTKILHVCGYFLA